MWASVLVMATLTAGMGGADVIWLNACDIDPAGIAFETPGAYSVWVWAEDDVETVVEIDGKEVTVGKAANFKNKYVWTKAGEVRLKAGTVKVKLYAYVAAVVLSTRPEFDPKKVMADTCVFDQPERVHDRRAETARHTDTVFTMPQFDSKEEWEALAARLRKRVLISSGLWPLPEKTPLNAQISGKIEHEDYSVEKVRFEARPGFLVTGNLYRPVGKQGPFPGVVCPHGHWEHGRIESVERGSIPGRCITLARMGMVVFSYDMIGYNDSLQFKHGWGDKAEKLWGIHPFAMQLWSSIRAVDFVEGLPDVDKDRLACTGASGGGTQTFALTAVDPRIKVSAPVNMISSTMQGGCLCENAPIIRMENSNMEIGALMAPRPMLMVSATGDWTRETPRVEFPAIQSIYRLYGAEDRVENVHIDAEHNYNKASREAMYRFFGKWLLGDGDKWAQFTEPEFTVEKNEDLLVFPDKKLPDGLPTSDQVIAQIVESNRAKWKAIMGKDPASVEAFRRDYGDVLELALGVRVPKTNEIVPERAGFEERDGYVVERRVIRRPCVSDAIPAILYRQADAVPRDAALVVHGDGKAALADANGGPGPLVTGLMAQGKAVLVIDAFLLGDHSSPFEKADRLRVGNFMDTFQPTDTGCRVQDVVTALAYLRTRRDLTGIVDLVGLGQAGVWCLFGGAIDGRVRTTIIDAYRFDSDDDKAWVDQHYSSCIRSVGDIDTAAELTTPRTMTVFNVLPSFSDGIEAAYKAAGSNVLTAIPDALSEDKIVEMLR